MKWIIKIIIIPLTVIGASFFINSLSNKIIQKEHEENKNMAQEQYKQTREIKLLELFYDDIKNKETQNNAVDLMSLMDDELSNKIRTYIKNSKELVNKDKLLNNADKILISKLNNLTIGLYPDIGNENNKISEEIKSKLFNINNQVNLKSYDKENVNKTLYRMMKNKCEIRYEKKTETEKAIILLNILNSNFPKLQCSIKQVQNKTPSFISIFINTNLKDK